ncbi:hypothetical protein [Erythrobacter sp. R86502]|uniref:hypothetical protein n=1 Tax=Erythrobacter sp. R86502 TaxID=3093846 RepID=UPI0036D37703
MTRGIWLAGAALLLSSGAMARDRAELQCIESGYTAEERAEIDELLPDVNMLDDAGDATMDAIGTVVGDVAIDCADTYEWNDSEFEAALFYELGRLVETAIRRHGPLPQVDVTNIDAALAKGDRSALWAALEEQVNIGIAGEDASVGEANAKVFEDFVMEIGFGMDEATAELVGAFLATLAMQRMSARNFVG